MSECGNADRSRVTLIRKSEVTILRALTLKGKRASGLKYCLYFTFAILWPLFTVIDLLWPPRAPYSRVRGIVTQRRVEQQPPRHTHTILYIHQSVANIRGNANRVRTHYHRYDPMPTTYGLASDADIRERPSPGIVTRAVLGVEPVAIASGPVRLSVRSIRVTDPSFTSLAGRQALLS